MFLNNKVLLQLSVMCFYYFPVFMRVYFALILNNTIQNYKNKKNTQKPILKCKSFYVCYTSPSNVVRDLNADTGIIPRDREVQYCTFISIRMKEERGYCLASLAIIVRVEKKEGG